MKFIEALFILGFGAGLAFIAIRLAGYKILKIVKGTSTGSGVGGTDEPVGDPKEEESGNGDDN